MKFKYFLGFVLSSFLLAACNNSSESIYLDSNYSYQERVDDLLSRMTIEEKVAQMCQYVGLNYLESDEDTLTAEEILNSDSRASYKGFLKRILLKWSLMEK